MTTKFKLKAIIRVHVRVCQKKKENKMYYVTIIHILNLSRNIIEGQKSGQTEVWRMDEQINELTASKLRVFQQAGRGFMMHDKSNF